MNEQKLNENQKKMLNGFLEDTTLKTAIAYKIKNEFDQLWNVQSQAVESLMEVWIGKTINTDLKPLQKFVNTIRNHYDGIINAIKTKITNAVSEGLNSVVQIARSRARGYRNITNFINMVYFQGNRDFAIH